MQQLAAVPLNTHPGARALGSHHGPRPDSPASTLSGSSPTNQGKVSMGAERNARFPNGFIQPVSSDDVVLTVPNRRTASIPFSLPSQRTMAKPVSSSIISTFDSHTSSPSSTRLDAYSSSSCAGAIAAHAAAADSTLQPPLEIQPPTTSPLSPILPPSNLFSCCQRSQHLASCGKTRDVSSLHVLSERLGAPLPPVERVLRHPICLTPGLPSLLPSAPQLSAAHFLPAKFSIEGVSARLSPAIITRQPQHPILSLPPISPISSPTEDSRRLRSRSLRSMPALPMGGSEDLGPAEHDNAALDDLDEEEDGVVDGDEDTEAEHPDTASEDGESTSGPPSSELSNPRNLPAIDTSPLNLSFVNANTSGTIRRDDKTPKDSRMCDYFTAKLAEPASYSQSHSPRQLPASWTSARTTPVIPTSRHSPNVLAASRGVSASRALPTPTTPIINLRPNMYHQASRSLCDMSEILKRSHHTSEVAAATPKSPLRNPAFKGDGLASETEELDTKLGPPLRRRLSMPTFGPSSAPPPYPHFRFGEHGPTIQPRDEEGSERLPQYTNDIYLRAVMPRKLEFTAPGVQARDRKWRRTLCVLEGTAFRVYKCPPAAAKKGLIGNLWEKTVGVGDIAAPPTQTPTSAAKAKEREQEREARQIKFASVDGGTPAQSPTSPTSPSIIMASPVSDEPEAQSSSSPRSRLLPSNFRRKNRNTSDRSLTSLSEMGARRSSSTPQQLAPELNSSRGVSLPTSPNRSTPRTPTETTSPTAGPPRALRSPRIKRRSLWVDDPTVPQPQEQDLVYAFAMHNAESGLGSDYLKRRNVIRVRMEGQQFLLQAPDVASVVEWIEVRHFHLCARMPKAMLIGRLTSLSFVYRASRQRRISPRIWMSDLCRRVPCFHGESPRSSLVPLVSLFVSSRPRFRRRRRRPQAQTNPSS